MVSRIVGFKVFNPELSAFDCGDSVDSDDGCDDHDVPLFDCSVLSIVDDCEASNCNTAFTGCDGDGDDGGDLRVSGDVAVSVCGV